MRGQRLVVWLGAAGAAIALAAFFIRAVPRQSVTQPAPIAGADRQGPKTTSAAAIGISREFASLAVGQRLDATIASGGTHGAVRGTLAAPSVTQLPNSSHPQYGLLATDYRLRVTSSLGEAASRYPIGRTITVRVPGGQIGSQGMAMEDTPHVAAGEDVYVLVSDIPPFFAAQWGTNTPSMVLALGFYDVFRVENGTVRGPAPYAVSEPVATFEQRFRR